MNIKTLAVGPLQTNCYIVVMGGVCLIIDPGYEPEKILKEAGNAPDRYVILLTHGHADHVGGARKISDKTEAPVFLHEKDLFLMKSLKRHADYLGMPDVEDVPEPEKRLSSFCDKIPEPCSFFHTPGHTPGGICLFFEKQNILFSGDTLFQGAVGRWDLEGGSFDVLMKSIGQNLLGLPDHTVIYPGHGFATTLTSEKKNNPFLKNIEKNT